MTDVIDAITHAVRAAELRRLEREENIHGLAAVAEMHSAAGKRSLDRMLAVEAVAASPRRL